MSDAQRIMIANTELAAPLCGQNLHVFLPVIPFHSPVVFVVCVQSMC